MFKLASTTYNTRHYNEIKRYFDKGANILHIVNENNEYAFDSKIETKYVNIEDDIQNVFNIPRYKIVNDLYDKPNCNVKFTTNDEEYNNIENCEVKLKYFKKFIC